MSAYEQLALDFENAWLAWQYTDPKYAPTVTRLSELGEFLATWLSERVVLRDQPGQDEGNDE